VLQRGERERERERERKCYAPLWSTDCIQDGSAWGAENLLLPGDITTVTMLLGAPLACFGDASI
jgi:hypothetical protein